MGPQDRSSSSSDIIVALASQHGFVCAQNEQNQWEISSAASQLASTPPQWQLCQQQGQQGQQADRWLLLVEGTAQILMRTAEAIAFINRQANNQ